MGTMTVAEARSEIKNLFEQADQIEKKYPDGIITDQQDEAQLKKLLTDVDSLEEKLVHLEDAEQRRKRILGGLERYNQPANGAQLPGQQADEQKNGRILTPGDQFVSSSKYRQLKMDGHFNSALSRVEFAINLKDGTSLVFWKQHGMGQKTLLYGSSATSGGGWVENDRQPGFVDILQRELSILDLIPRIPTDSDTIEYVQETAWTNTAGTVLEATATTGTSGIKPEAAMLFEVKTSPVTTVAHWLPVTNRMLADAPAIRGTINSRLLYGLDQKLEDQVLTGNGAGANLTGILETAGINIQGKGSDNEADAIFKARTQIRVTGRARPNAVVMHPNDWQAIRLMRENAASATLGNYLMGPPSILGPVTIWGMPVVESDGITENTSLVGDFIMGATLFDREQGAIRVGTIDSQFIRNMQTILAELRAAFVVYRPSAFTKVTGM
jgi:HK97 family phage major capsid protein